MLMYSSFSVTITLGSYLHWCQKCWRSPRRARSWWTFTCWTTFR